MTVWYKNYLGDPSQPWARQVQKEVDNQKSAFQTAEVNNVKRDAQLQSSLRQVQASAAAATDAAAAAGEAAEDAQDAADLANGIINNIYTADTTEIAGSKISDGTISIGKLVAGTITGDVINGGTITGVTIQSAASGQRVEMTGTRLNFYNGTESTGSIVGSEAVASSNTLQVGNTAGYVFIGNGSSTFFGGTNPSAFTVLAGNTQVNDGSFSVEGTTTSLGYLITNASLTRTILAGGGTTTASINDTGNFIRTSSSQRYKQDIEALELPYDSILQLQPKKFRRVDEVESNPDAKFYPGFIAEDLAGTDLDIFTFYSKDEDGNPRPEGIHYAELTAALVSAIKTQDQMIKSLEARLTALESR
jgi:hypothetical protein